MIKTLQEVGKQALKFGSENLPSILTGIGIVGVAATAFATGEASIKAYKELEKLEYESKEKPDTKEKAKVVAPIFLPAAITGGLTITCIAFANYINIKRMIAIASAYSITETKLKDFKEKTEELVGKNKKEKIEDAIAKDKVINTPPDDHNVITTGLGETLCYDQWSGRYFRSDIESIKKAQNDLNAVLISDMWVSLNDLYYKIGLPGIKIGNELGWNLNYDGQIDITFSSQLTDRGEPCLVIDYLAAPRYDFNEFN